jgi:hypothetical protein
VNAQIEPLGEDELANDEVAELVAMYRVLDVEINVDGTTENAEAQTYSAKAEMAVNFEGGSSAFLSSDQNLGINGVAEEGDDAIFDVAMLGDSPGPYNESANPGSSGGGGLNASQRWISFRKEFGQGPFLDNDDDLSVRVEAANRNGNHGVFADYYLLLWWDVSTVAGARPTLAPPGGV